MLKFYLLILSMILSGFITSCSDNDDNPLPPHNDKGEYSFSTKYNYVRSYQNGGGIFIIYISPQEDFDGTVNLKLEADPMLNASLNSTTLSKSDSVAEITVRPSVNAEIKTFKIEVIATHGNKEKRIQLHVELFEWESGNPETTLQKRDEFKSWILSRSSEYKEVFEQPLYTYMTYPEILIVEHHTFLTKNYEVRLCFHVMIPPYDWSMLYIRKLGCINAELAAKRESNGTINIIPVSEYPSFGY